ncbi:Trk system potassium transporter TrkA [Candidatus Pseudothioglobus singularis]|nr:Trk system potassium transporter TrkA [Candidatus Pseudothioglobus singularis]
MKILILGAGQVGSTLARYLCLDDDNDITIVDQKEEMLTPLQRHLDIKTVIGYGAYPSVLEKAGIKSMDVVIAVMNSDERNMVACRMAHTLYNVKKKIARIRTTEYLLRPEIFSNDALPIDFLITPENLITEYIQGIVEEPGASQVFDFENGLVQLVETRAFIGTPIVNRPIKELHEHMPDVKIRIVSLYRNERAISAKSDTVIREGDQVYFLAKKDHISRALKEFRRAENNYQKIFIAGGGSIGLNVAKLLEETHNIRIIELSEDRAKYLSEKLNNTLVLQGNASDEDLLKDEGIENTDLFLALTDSDEVNVIVSILAKRLGAHKTIALVKRDVYASLAEQSGDVDIIVSPDQITVSGILSHLRKGDCMKVHSLQHGKSEAIEIVVHGDEKTSAVVGVQIKDLPLPEGVVVGAVVRDNELLMGSKKLVIESGDHILMVLMDVRKIHEVEALFLENEQ